MNPASRIHRSALPRSARSNTTPDPGSQAAEGSGVDCGLLGTVLFHLNINYSAIEVADRPEVVRRCYWPMLELCERLPWLVLAVEASAYTLETVRAIDPSWIDELRALVDTGRIEFIGAGDTQLIGPLVPAAVNRWNQKLGQESYAEILGRRPTTALVGEMAWSQGIIDAYVEAGYQTLLMEWNNPRRQHPEWNDEWRYGRVRSVSPTGRSVAVSWVDAIAFQKFQRAVVGDIRLDEYADWVLDHAGPSVRHLFVYASDAEVFDFRPGRFGSEPELTRETSEWTRIEEMLVALWDRGLRFTSPERMSSDPRFAPVSNPLERSGIELQLGTSADPIPVKKQPKYNVTRWGLSGRDDVGLNAACHRQAARLEREGGSPSEWRELCRGWASDHRTHLTQARWESLTGLRAGSATRAECAVEEPLSLGEVERAEDRLRIETDQIAAELDLRRGLAFSSLCFKDVSASPVLGTLPHGYFEDIDWAADFYSGHTVMDVPAAARVTDLQRVEPTVLHHAGRIEVEASVPTTLGTLVKRFSFFRDRVELFFGLAALGERPVASLRTGVLTLFTENLGEDLSIVCAHGGPPERFPITGECDHGRGVSALVSARAAFGATDGSIVIEDGKLSLEASWRPDEVAALPLLTCKNIGQKRFVRLAFSLSEIDETHRPGAPLHDFRLTLRARRLAK